MAIWSTDTNIDAKRYVAASSRYSKSKVRHLTENKIISFETYKRKPIGKNIEEEYAEITKSVEYRPDLVSQEVYSTPDFWWIIMEHNGMKDILEFQAGKIIKLPLNIIR